MKGYSERSVFLPSVTRLHTFLCKVLEHFDSSPYSIEPDKELRCHELTRAVKRFIAPPARQVPHSCVPHHPQSVTLFDGKYSIVDHSWLELLTKSAEGYPSLYILDVYAVGQLPQVQLLDLAFSLPHRASYRPQARRDDINMNVVNLVYEDLLFIGKNIFNEGG